MIDFLTPGRDGRTRCIAPTTLEVPETVDLLLYEKGLAAARRRLHLRP